MRNPRTGDRVDVPSKRVAYFKPGKELKELINRDPAQPVPPPFVRVAGIEPLSRRPRRVFVGRLPRTRVDSLCERRVKTIWNDRLAIVASPRKRTGRSGRTTKLVRDRGLSDRATAHGFRTSFRTWASERASVPHAVCERRWHIG